MQVGIAADVLTSAADGAVPFVQRGHACDVLFGYRFAPPPRADVLSINKDSHAQSRREAAQRTRAATLKLRGADVLRYAVNSTIRGHLEAEILAAPRASGCKFTLLALAFPEAKRTTENGEQKLDGKPMHTTVSAFDLVHPIRQHVIGTLFPSLAVADVQNLLLPTVRALRPGSFKAKDFRTMGPPAEAAAAMRTGLLKRAA